MHQGNQRKRQEGQSHQQQLRDVPQLPKNICHKDPNNHLFLPQGIPLLR